MVTLVRLDSGTTTGRNGGFGLGFWWDNKHKLLGITFLIFYINLVFKNEFKST